MQLAEYFTTQAGLGVLSTADADGKVDAAIYARPHVFDDGTLAFVMRDRLTHHNLQQNPHAAYLFVEKGPGYRGLRLYLRKLGEETDSELIDQLSRRCLSPEEDLARGAKFLVRFAVEERLQLIGGQPADMQR